MRIRHRWSPPAGFVVVVAGLIGVGILAGPGAAAVHSVEIAADAVYLLDPVGGRIDVDLRVAIRNDEASGGAAVGAVSMALPAAVSPVASRNGRALDVRAGTVVGDLQVFEIDLGRELLAGRTTEVIVGFSITDEIGGGRSSTRIGPAYVSFASRGYGDPGTGSVEIIVPVRLATDWVGVDPDEVEQGYVQSFRMLGVGRDFAPVFEARDDEALDRTSVTVADAAIEIAGWPGDETWRDEVAEGVAVLIPALEDVIGAPWPLQGPLTIRETNAGVVHGYDGTFSRDASRGGEIELGSVVDGSVLAHELAHAWFDGAFEPWIAEGLAEELGRQALVDGGVGVPSFESEVASDDEHALPLLEWEPFVSEAAVDRYAYAAAASIFDRLRTDLGADRLRGAVRTLFEGTSAYGPTLPSADAIADWQRLIDAVDERGPSEVEALLVEWVLPPSERSALRPRRLARDRLGAFAARAGEWGVPEAVLVAMTRWDFATANEALDAADTLLDERDRVAERSAEMGLRLPTRPAETFARDPLAAAQELLDQAAGLDAVADADAARTAPLTTIERIGLWGTDRDAAYLGVVAAFENGDHALVETRRGALVGSVSTAGDLGTRRVAAAVAVVAAFALVSLVVHMGRARRRSSGR